MLTDYDVDTIIDWGNMARRNRRWFIAQNGKCPYCGRRIECRTSIHPGQCPADYPWRDMVIPSTDHVRPHRRGKGHSRIVGNRVLCCALCNFIKGDRAPRPCEILFAEVTGEIMLAMLPPNLLTHYLKSQPKEAEADV